MTNYEWVKERILQEIDTPEKMKDAMISGLHFPDIDEELSSQFCNPQKIGCTDETKLNETSFVAPCEECIMKWLKEGK